MSLPQDEWEGELEQLRGSLLQAATQLSAARRRAAPALARHVEECLAQLAMGGARVDVSVAWQPEALVSCGVLLFGRSRLCMGGPPTLPVRRVGGVAPRGLYGAPVTSLPPASGGTSVPLCRAGSARSGREHRNPRVRGRLRAGGAPARV